MYYTEYKRTEENFGFELNRAIYAKYKSVPEFARALSERVNLPYDSLVPRIYEWEGGKIPSLKRCIEICRLLGVDLDGLLGHWDGEARNREIDFIREKTGLTAENIEALKKLSETSGQEYKDLDRESRIKQRQAKERLRAINAILSSDEGLRIIEQMINYIAIDPDTLIVDTPGGTFAYGEADFALVGDSINKDESIVIKKEEIANMYLVGILNELNNLKRKSASSTKACKK